ncbi:hypothetical protein B0H12DRAFT_1220683 [Mycena haematopus]|nr:hypothetical protein B0H12DRAFT_1220683 [Mycena haematopus]
MALLNFTCKPQSINMDPLKAGKLAQQTLCKKLRCRGFTDVLGRGWSCLCHHGHVKAASRFGQALAWGWNTQNGTINVRITTYGASFNAEFKDEFHGLSATDIGMMAFPATTLVTCTPWLRLSNVGHSPAPALLGVVDAAVSNSLKLTRQTEIGLFTGQEMYRLFSDHAPCASSQEQYNALIPGAVGVPPIELRDSMGFSIEL